MSFKWKIGSAINYGRFSRKLTSKAGTKSFFKVWAPISLLKCSTPLYVKFHRAQCVKGDCNWMEPIPIGEQQTTQISSILELWVTLIGIHLTREPAASATLTKWWNWELMAANFGNTWLTTLFCTRQITALDCIETVPRGQSQYKDVVLPVLRSPC